MAFFAGLISFFGLLWLLGAVFSITPLQDVQFNATASASIMFVLIGIMHFHKPEALTYMIEGFLPYAKTIIYVSGALEILLAVGLWFPATTRYAAWGLIVLLIAMFPANINVAFNNLPPPGGLPAKPWYVWSRLLFQPIYIVWIWWAVLYTPAG
jgi:uncharacterized membrane protein